MTYWVTFGKPGVMGIDGVVVAMSLGGEVQSFEVSRQKAGWPG